MRVNRCSVRGSRLLPICRNARIDRWEADNGIHYYYCYGVKDKGRVSDECRKCPACTSG